MRFLKVTMLLLCLSVPASRLVGQQSTCDKIPKYKPGKVIISSRTELLRYISITPDHFNRSDLPCLARELKRRFVLMQKHKVVNVEVFDDSDAARQPNLRVLTTEARPSDYRIHQHIHGSYHFDMGDEYVLLEPDPRDDQTTTKLSLTEGSSTSCTLKIGPDRCLTAMNHIEYPIEAWRLAESGTVELSVTVAADGRVTAEGVVAPETASEALRDAARESAASWRFERAQSAQILDVTYRFQLVGAPDFLPHDKVEYHLPNEIVITANPPRGPGPTM